MTLRRASDATTRAATVAAGPHAGRLLGQDETITSPETGLTYRIGRLLGQGGFGQVYLATRLGRSTTVPATVCIKVSPHINGWLREAYFGQLLGDHPRAIRVYDAFPLTNRPGKRLLYGLVLEYAQQGDLSAFLSRTSRKWSETAVRREIAGILEVLGKLHRGQLLHRDLTPLNVFVCDGPRLKLGDFGIVRSQTDNRGITVHTLNPHMAPSDIVAGRRAQVAGARRRLPGRPADRDAGQRVRARAHPQTRSARVQLQRPPEGSDLPLHRRAQQALRKRHRADRGAVETAGGAEGGRACGRSGARTWPSPAS